MVPADRHTPVLDERSVGVVVMHTDITARKHAETKLLSLSERLSLATEVAKVGVWDWELATDVHTWDATMSAIYGLQPADLINYEKWSSSVHPEDLPGFEANLRAAIDEKGVGSGEFRIVLADGAVKNIAFVEKAVLDENANVIRVIGVNVDITDRKQAEEALRRSEAKMTHLAEHDYLTGLPNRKLLNDRIYLTIKGRRDEGANRLALEDLRNVSAEAEFGRQLEQENLSLLYCVTKGYR